MQRTALITGITGQDGSYLAELLLEKNYTVYGIMRSKSVVDYGNVAHLKEKIHFVYADMTDVVSLVSAMRISQADEVYNLVAQSFVATSWEQLIITVDIDVVARIKLNIQDHVELGNLDAKRDWGHSKDYIYAMWLMLQQEKPDEKNLKQILNDHGHHEKK